MKVNILCLQIRIKSQEKKKQNYENITVLNIVWPKFSNFTITGYFSYIP